MALTALQIQHARPGMHADGGGLYLRVQDTGNKGWILRYQLAGKRREMGLGTLASKSAKEARAQAAALVLDIKAGRDPIDHRSGQAAAAQQAAVAKQATNVIETATFEAIATEYIEGHAAGWKNAKHAAQWTTTLTTYAFPEIGSKPVHDVSTDDVLQILKPIWTTKTETASRVRSRLELVLSYAKAKGLRQGENPAQGRGHLDALLPKPAKVKRVRHHPALPWSRISAFMGELRKMEGIGAKALELAILTASRSGEIRGAVWREFDLDAGVWVIPAIRMKAEREHRIPLSAPAVRLLKALRPNESRSDADGWVFKGERKGSPLSDMTLLTVIRRMNEANDKPDWVDAHGVPVVPHGFRSTFRDWAGESTAHAREVVEHALAHRIPDRAEAAYARGSLFEKRRRLMEDWADSCGRQVSGPG